MLYFVTRILEKELLQYDKKNECVLHLKLANILQKKLHVGYKSLYFTMFVFKKYYYNIPGQKIFCI